MYRTAIAVTLVAIVMCDARGPADDDPVKAKLDAAREVYKAELERYRNDVGKWFDKREDDARKPGDKKMVDQIKAERAAFAQNGELPAQAPAALKGTPKAARAKLEAAYEAAVKEYTKVRKDDLAAAVEREFDGFRKGDAIKKADLLPARDDRRLWVQPRGYFIKGEGKDWFEKWDDGNKMPNLFIEVARTKEYVELRNPHVPVSFRLYADKAVVRDNRNGNEFADAYKGGWKAPGK
jgi:hypothetical protein